MGCGAITNGILRQHRAPCNNRGGQHTHRTARLLLQNPRESSQPGPRDCRPSYSSRFYAANICRMLPALLQLVRAVATAYAGAAAEGRELPVTRLAERLRRDWGYGVALLQCTHCFPDILRSSMGNLVSSQINNKKTFGKVFHMANTVQAGTACACGRRWAAPARAAASTASACATCATASSASRCRASQVGLLGTGSRVRVRSGSPYYSNYSQLIASPERFIIHHASCTECSVKPRRV